MKFTARHKHYLLWGLFVGILSTTCFVFAGRIRESIPLAECGQSTACNSQIRFNLRLLYSFDTESLFANYRVMWIWETLHPDVCTLHHEAPGISTFAHKIDVWDISLAEFSVRDWELISQHPPLVYWSGYSGIHTAVQDEFLPSNIEISGCALWMMVELSQPEVTVINIEPIHLSYHPSNFQIRKIHWACEMWESDEYSQAEQREAAINQLVERRPLGIHAQQLNQLCDWYLWCSADESTCVSGGQRFQMDIFLPPQ